MISWANNQFYGKIVIKHEKVEEFSTFLIYEDFPSKIFFIYLNVGFELTS